MPSALIYLYIYIYLSPYLYKFKKIEGTGLQVEDWYKWRNGTFEIVPLYQTVPLYQATVVLPSYSAKYHRLRAN